MRPQLSQGVCCPQCRSGCIVTLVARASAGSVCRLLQRVHRQHTEADRQRVAYRYGAQPPGGLACDVLEMRGFSPDNCSKRDQTAIPAGFRCRRRGHRELKRTGQPDDIDLLARKPGFVTAGEGPLEKLGGDQLIVAAYQDRHSPGGAEAAGEVGHGISG